MDNWPPGQSPPGQSPPDNLPPPPPPPHIISLFGLLPNCHALYENHSRSVQAVTVSNLLREIMNHELCPGLPLEQGDKVISHVIPCRIDLKSQQHLPVSAKMFSRDERCVVLCMDICCRCRSLLKKIETKKSNVKPLRPNTPLSNVNPERGIEALKLERKENRELCKRLEKKIQLKCCWSRFGFWL